MNLTLRQLEIFAAVAVHEHIGRAAEELSLSPSAASMALGELENVIGYPLFDRIARRIVLNEHGRLLLPKVLALLDRAEEIEAGMADGQPAGHLRVGASTTIGNYLLPGIVGAFANACPAIQVQLEVNNTQSIIRHLLEHRLDLALVEGPVSHSDLVESVWTDDELVVFAAPAQANVSLDAAQWIMREPGSGTREVFEQAMRAAGHPIHLRLELGHTEAIKKAVEAGLGLGCLSRRVIVRELELGYVVPVPWPGLALRRTFSLFWHRQKYHSAAFERFVAFCRQAVQK
ncbi:MAG: LysR family transcriptional regulator [Verrucomicrobiota bacterium JB022]|nr:LysR family transcriptional regulator [Verrucomicrobiota bacterium JB022]